MTYTSPTDVELFRDRAVALAQMLDPGTERLLEHFGVGDGWRCLEAGAGPGSIARWLSDRVGSRGLVTALDLHPQLLDGIARPNVEVVGHDLTSELPLPGAYDLVHARWILHWLPNPRVVLARLAGALAPGGLLLVEEPDFVTLTTGARSDALGRVLQAGTALGAHMTGVDNFYGRHLPEDLAALGLSHGGVDGRVGLIRGGEPSSGAEWLRLCIQWISDQLIRNGAVSDSDLAESLDRLGDPSFSTPTPLTVAAWGTLDTSGPVRGAP